MADYDGSIRIGTQIDVKGAERELKSLESSISKTDDKIASLRSKMDALKDAKLPTEQYAEYEKILASAENKLTSLYKEQEKFLSGGGKKSTPTYQKMIAESEQLERKITGITKAMDLLERRGEAFALGADTDEYAQMAAQMQQLNQQMESDTQRQAELQSALAAEEERLAQIKANATVSDQQILDLLERRKQLLQEISDLEKADVGLGYQEYDSANQELAEINNQINAYKNNLSSVPEKFSKMKDSAKKAFDAVSSGTKKSSGLFSTFTSRLKGMALSLLIFNWISKAFNAMISGMKTGFTNFMNYSDSFANSVQGMKNAMSTLGNQFAAAFSPIVQTIIPWLTKLINAISTAMTYVAQFIAILGGKSTFTRAKQVQDSYNKSLGGTAAAAKKAYGALAKFDDLDVLQKKEDDSDAGGGMADAMGDLFEEVPVDSKFKDWLDGILEKLKPILDYLKKLKDIFMEGFWDGLGDWEYRWEIIKDSIASIKESLIDIFTDPAVLAAADRWAQSLVYMLGSLVGSMASIGLTIAANLLGGIASYLEDNKDRIKKYLISMFDVWTEINYMLANFFQSFAYVFETFASEGGIQLTANLIGIFADAFMGITELASKVARDILNIFIQPFVDNKEALRTALEGFLEVLSEVTGTIKKGIDDTFDKLNEVYDAHFKPFFDSVAQGLSDLTGKFLDFWNGKVQPILDQWAADFDALWSGHIQPLLDNVAEFLGKISDLLKALWENILQPLIEWIIDNVLPRLLPVFEAMWDMLVELVGYITDMASDVIDILSGVIDFLTGIFSGDWERVFNGILESTEGFIGYLRDTLEGGIALILDFIVEKLEEFSAFLPETGRNIVQGLIDGILSFKDKAVESISEIATSILDTLKNVLSIHSPSDKTEEIGEYTIDGYIIGLENKASNVSDIWILIKEQTISILQSLADWISNFRLSISDGLVGTLQNIQLFFAETWISIYETTLESWTGIQEWFNEFWLIFTETLYEIWEGIILFFTETWENITLIFQTFIEFINEVVIPVWQESWNTAQIIFQAFQTLITTAINTIKTLFNDFFGKVVKTLIDVNWKNAWENAKKIFTEFKDKVSEVINTVREIIQSFFDWAMGIINSILSAIGNIGSAISGIFGGGGSGGGSGSAFRLNTEFASPAMASYSTQNFSAFMDNIPHLASGSVIRGGNPFIAILGDQRVGQTNIEAPLSTIEQAVENVMKKNERGNEQIPVTINLNWDGETFARLSISDILSELARQGYDVDVLGVT